MSEQQQPECDCTYCHRERISQSQSQQPEQDWAREAEGRICDEIARVLGGRDAGMVKANIDIAALIREAHPPPPDAAINLAHSDSKLIDHDVSDAAIERAAGG